MVTRVMAMMVGVSLCEGVVMEVPCLLISVLVGWFVSGLVSFDEGDGAPDGFFVDAFFGAVCADHGASSGVDGDVVVVVWVSPEEEVAGLGLGEAVDGGAWSCATRGSSMPIWA